MYLMNKEIVNLWCIEQFDLIEQFVDSITRIPNFRHIEGGNLEYFIAVVERPITDLDPLYRLAGALDRWEFGKTLNWTNKACLE